MKRRVIVLRMDREMAEKLIDAIDDASICDEDLATLHYDLREQLDQR